MGVDVNPKTKEVSFNGQKIDYRAPAIGCGSDGEVYKTTIVSRRKLNTGDKVILRPTRGNSPYDGAIVEIIGFGSTGDLMVKTQGIKGSVAHEGPGWFFWPQNMVDYVDKNSRVWKPKHTKHDAIYETNSNNEVNDRLTKLGELITFNQNTLVKYAAKVHENENTIVELMGVAEEAVELAKELGKKVNELEQKKIDKPSWSPDLENFETYMADYIKARRDTKEKRFARHQKAAKFVRGLKEDKPITKKYCEGKEGTSALYAILAVAIAALIFGICFITP